ncbi:hypothetical protein Tco_0542267 [Tanacetum coccineum]
MPDLEDDSEQFSSDGIFNGAYDDENKGAVADFNNMDDTIIVNPIPILRIYKNHPKDQILGDPKSAVQTRGKIKKASSATTKHLFCILCLDRRKEDYDEVFAPVAKIEAISHDKYVADILKKFDFWSSEQLLSYVSNKPSSGPWYEDGKDVGCTCLRIFDWISDVFNWIKQTIVANSTTEDKYVAVLTGYGKLLWIPKSDDGLGYNFNEDTDPLLIMGAL